MTDELDAVLSAHARRYPLMRPRDAVKLVYQNEFGGGHLIRDHAASLAALRRECAAAGNGTDGSPFIEELGGGLVRVSLRGLEENGYPPEELDRDFIRSTRLHTGTREGFARKLNRLREAVREGIFGFSTPELDSYLREYAAGGYPMVSHSEAYRAAYHPAYRVIVRSVSAPLFVCRLRELARTGRRILAAIDGRCAAGKTTWAETLAARWGWNVVHMDDFFLRPNQRTRARYTEPGGNVDYERFRAEVLLPFRAGEAVRYRPFDCHTMELKEPVLLKSTPVTLVEGSYSCHPSLWEFYDVRAFVTVSPEEQWKRLLRRNGPESAEIFRRRWIPLEERYFSAFSVEQRCEYTVLSE